MKIVSLCGDKSCCPVIKLSDEKVEIGEEGNLCVLKLDEWESLKSKILHKELQKSNLFPYANLSPGYIAGA